MSCTILPPEDAFFLQCSKALKEGQLVAFPTETVYGLGAHACDDAAVARIYKTKGRPSFNPLIVHLAYADDVPTYASLTPLAHTLAKAFWPGPCTLVLERRADCPLSLLVSAGLDTVALRVPAHPVAHQLLKTSGLPLAAPSANRSGRISPTIAAHVQREFADHDLSVLDGGACQVGLESTVIDARGEVPVLLRPGSITEADITAACGIPPIRAEHAPKELHSPGMLASHYAPDRPVRLNADSAKEGEALLGFGKVENATLNLSPESDLVEAAANLFAYMRKLDTAPYTGIAVNPIPDFGLGLAINDRLRRAAADR
jgi:L-threonylcarbamoyladenylate synthase